MFTIINDQCDDCDFMTIKLDHGYGNNFENGHYKCHGHQLGHHQHHNHHDYAQYWLDPIESMLLNNNAWHHIQPL